MTMNEWAKAWYDAYEQAEAARPDCKVEGCPHKAWVFLGGYCFSHREKRKEDASEQAAPKKGT